jgi:hypothetical protein
MPFRLTELGCQEGLDEVPSHGRAHCPAAHADDVHVVVLDPLPGREVIVNQAARTPGILLAQTDAPTKLYGQFLLQLESAVIGGDANSHVVGSGINSP